MNRDILLLGTAREGSTRLKSKMIKQFCDTTLFDLYMQLFEKLSQCNIFNEIGMAIYDGDEILMDIADKYKVPIISRSLESVTGLRRRSEELHFLNQFKSNYVMWINGCLPFIKPDTIIDAAEYFIMNKDVSSMTPVMCQHNWFWDLNNKPINNLDPTCVSTQSCPHIFKSLHAFHIFNREFMLKNDSYWSYSNINDPKLYTIDDNRKIEFLDIDDEFDFEICEVTYEKFRKRT